MISVIVPVYNVEKYLRECVDSILSQSYPHFELLLIDDGSTDGSGTICDEYAEQDSRVCVFHKSNGGVSSARNLGLDNAQGEWVIFLDSDDYWNDKDVLNDLISYAQSNSRFDIVRGEYISVDAQKNPIEIKDYSAKRYLEKKILSNAEFIKEAVAGEFFVVLCLIRRSLLSNIRFDTEMVFLEDVKFYLELLSLPLKCGYILRPFYAYRKIASSASNRINVKKLEDSFGMCDFYWQISEKVENEVFKEYCKTQSVMMYYWTLQTLASEPYYYKRSLIIKELHLYNLHERTVARMMSSSVKNTYRIFISPVPYVGVILLHLKDKIRLMLS